MNITEEMLDRAAEAVCARYEAMIGSPPPAIKVHAIRADAREVILAAAPLIAAQAALAERVKIVAEIREHAERAGRTLGSSHAASVAVAAITNEVADRINALPKEKAKEPDRTCPRCGSPEWVSVSLDTGFTRRAQCVPCGFHHAALGPGWKAS